MHFDIAKPRHIADLEARILKIRARIQAIVLAKIEKISYISFGEHAVLTCPIYKQRMGNRSKFSILASTIAWIRARIFKMRASKSAI